MKFKLLTLLGKFKRFQLRKLKANISIHPTTRLLRNFSVNILTPVENRKYLEIGENGLINASFIFEDGKGSISVGDRCYFGGGGTVMSRNRVEIGNDVTFAWNVTLYDHDSHSKDWRQRSKVVEVFYKHYGKADCYSKIDWTGVNSAPICIKDKVWIGFDVVVLKGVTIGEGAIVGAKSVVTKDVEPFTIVAGNPARVIKKISPPSTVE